MSAYMHGYSEPESRRCVCGAEPGYIVICWMCAVLFATICITEPAYCASPADHLVVCEAVLTPTASEFIEIGNPTNSAVSLGNYYLSDDADYALLPGAYGDGPAPNINSSDFIVRFPAGSSIASKSVVVVALDGAGFHAAFGFRADFEIKGTDVSTPDMVAVDVGGSVGLTDGGENAVLFYWDGAGDLVRDVDMVNLGTPSAANAIAGKTSLSVDGPDADTVPTSYVLDSVSMPLQAGDPGSGKSTKRTSLEGSHETSSGGNGITGDDETSENIAVTWDSSFSTPDPGVCAAVSPPAAGLVINEIHADPDASHGDANGNGTVDTYDDEFIEIVNASTSAIDVSGWTVSDAVSVRHTFPTGTIVPAEGALVLFGGGTPAGGFGASVVQTASTGGLRLNNGGDSVVLNDGTADTASYSYGSEGGDNQSLTRSPDVTGADPLVKHMAANGAGGRRFSPGTRVDGTAFPGNGSIRHWVVNEVHADPHSQLGDANNDGMVDTGDDEFVELVNISGNQVDVSGWTLSDGHTVRHVFPAGTIVPDQCAIVVFGGGLPTGFFGGAVVQTASSGALGLNNGGDTVTLNDETTDQAVLAYGGEGGQDQSITRNPDITGLDVFARHASVPASGGALYSPGTMIDGSFFPGSVPPPQVEIHTIQGNGPSSPLVGTTVSSLSNIVTAVAEDGFYMQTPDNRSDGDPETSNGIFVYTGSSPTVQSGDLVNVIGLVLEFFGMTEITGAPLVEVLSNGNPLPSAAAWGVALPSPNQPRSENELERFEGMRVQISEGMVCGPSDGYGRAKAVASAVRTFREPGIAFPGLAGLPVWDGNPQVFGLDPSGLGGPDRPLSAGTRFSAVGVLNHESNAFQVLPTSLDIQSTPVLPRSVRIPSRDEFTIATLNLQRLFDDVDDPGPEDDGQVISSDEYALRLRKISLQILQDLQAPTILAIQEAEGIQVLQDLAERIEADDPIISYEALLTEGNDPGGIDVGYLIRSNVVVRDLSRIGANERFTVDSTALHDRPPLRLDATVSMPGSVLDITVVNVHLRSRLGIEDPTEGSRVRQKRFEQALSISLALQAIQEENPEANLAVTGDFNAFQFSDGYVDVVGQISGDLDPAGALLPGSDELEPNLKNLIHRLPESEQYSFVYEGNAQALDHILASRSLDELASGVAFSRGNSDAPRTSASDGATSLRSSDHDGLVIHVKPRKPDLRLVKKVNREQASIGEQLSYTLSVINAGEGNATAVSLTDSLPSEVRFDAALSSVGVVAHSNGTVTFELGDLASGEIAVATISVTLKGSGAVVNTAWVTSDQDDPSPDDNVASATVLGVDPTMAPTFASGGPHAWPNPAAPGEPVHFFAGASNPGDSALTYSWDFGDGTRSKGERVTHRFESAGKYTVKVWLTDGVTTSSSQVVVRVAEPLDVYRLESVVRFAVPQRDRFLLRCGIRLPDEFNEMDQVVFVNAGGVAARVKLNARGVGRTGKSRVWLRRSRRGNTWVLKFSNRNTSLAASMASMGLTRESEGPRWVSVPIAIVVGDRHFRTHTPRRYSVRSGMLGYLR